MSKLKIEYPKEHQECKDGKCGHQHQMEIELPKLGEIKPNEIPKVVMESPKPEPEVKIEEKIVEKVKAPSDQPFYKCKDCGDKHPNPNYGVKPNKKCPNCDSLNGSKNCKNCNKETDADDWEELDDEQLEELGIPMPKEENHNNHDHEHEP